jgi:hypothetical protein
LFIKAGATLRGRPLKYISDDTHQFPEFGLRDSIGLSVKVKFG